MGHYTINGVYLTNYKFVDTPSMFDQEVGQLLTKLCIHAYDSDFKVACGELETGILHYGLIYGAAQCTSDLSSHYCKKCLNVAMTELLKKVMEGGVDLLIMVVFEKRTSINNLGRI